MFRVRWSCHHVIIKAKNKIHSESEEWGDLIAEQSRGNFPSLNFDTSLGEVWGTQSFSGIRPSLSSSLGLREHHDSRLLPPGPLPAEDLAHKGLFSFLSHRCTDTRTGRATVTALFPRSKPISGPGCYLHFPQYISKIVLMIYCGYYVIVSIIYSDPAENTCKIKWKKWQRIHGFPKIFLSLLLLAPISVSPCSSF